MSETRTILNAVAGSIQDAAARAVPGKHKRCLEEAARAIRDISDETIAEIEAEEEA